MVHLDFTWPFFGQFPHPTFKLGTVEAYQLFARILLAFMQTGDNFHFLAQNNLFDILLGYAAASTVQVEDGWTFRELVYDFAFGDNIYSSIGSGTRSGLAAVNERIEALGRILGGVSLLWPLMLRSWRAAQ